MAPRLHIKGNLLNKEGRINERTKQNTFNRKNIAMDHLMIVKTYNYRQKITCACNFKSTLYTIIDKIIWNNIIASLR
jgi:hypothetical protein